MDAKAMKKIQQPDAAKILSYEEFRFKPSETIPFKKQPFNNFYFYFLNEDISGMFYTIYRNKPWFKEFEKDHKELLDAITVRMSYAYSDDTSGNPDKLMRMLATEEEVLYKAYLLARQYATNNVLFQ